jgi:hypothetical protein
MSALLTCENDSSSLPVLPTLVASMGNGNRGGQNPDGPFRPSLV